MVFLAFGIERKWESCIFDSRVFYWTKFSNVGGKVRTARIGGWQFLEFHGKRVEFHWE